MSAAGSTPQAEADETTPEKKSRASCHLLHLIEQAHDCILWTPESDFSEVCSCDECRPKIERLNEFQKEINAKMKLVDEYGSDVDAKEYLCMNICFSVHSTKDILKFLGKKLEAAAVSEKSGVQPTLETSSLVGELRGIYKKMAKKLREEGIFGGSVGKDPDDYDDSAAATDDENDNEDISDKIDTLRFYYRNTKVKDSVYDFLQDIRDLEKDWLDKKIDEMHKLENQIKVVMKFPVKKLQNEFDEKLAEILPRELYSKNFVDARECIYTTCYHFVKKVDEFWKSSSQPTKVNEHTSNGLQETLESLLTEVDLFKKHWEKEFAHVFTPRDRSNPKRQLVE